jgi:DNA anti-recombination protein RmuC
LIDDATSRKVVLCSPLTLYTFLGVARQATDSFHMEQNANEVLSIFDAVGKSWERYTKEISKIDKAFKSVTELFRVVSPDGAAFKNLAKQFKKVDHLIEEKGITSTSDSSLDDDLTLLLGEEDQ